MNLTEKQKQILKLIADGKTQKEVGSLIFMSRESVELQLTQARKKNECITTYQLLAGAVRFKFI
jgi:DNA-binding CsgD family transcriptional regulator